MTCSTTFETLSAYVDGELSGEESGQVKLHLTACETCRLTVRSLKATKHAVSRLQGRRQPTEALRARVTSLRFGDPATGSTNRRRAFVLVAAVLLLGGAVALGIWGIDRQRQPEWASLLVNDHLHSVPAAKPADVTSSDPEVVRQFFVERVAFSPVVPELPGMRLIGGRLCTLEEQRVQLLFYEHDGQVLSLFVSGGDTFPETCAESKGHNVCVRQKDAHEFMLVGALGAASLQATLNTI